MPQDDETFELASSGRPDYVPVVVAKSMEQAEKYRELLDENDIPAIADPDYEEEGEARKGRGRMTRGVPVLVPEALLDEASEIIADCEDLDEFTPAAEGVEEEDDEEEDEIEADDEEEIKLEDEEELVEDELEGGSDAGVDLDEEEEEEKEDEEE